MLKSNVSRAFKSAPVQVSLSMAIQKELTPALMQSCAQKTLTLEKVSEIYIIFKATITKIPLHYWQTLENFIGTGNLPSKTGLGLMQDKGLSIMAENINRMRYMAHFRAIHRGTFFQEMRTTDVRALLPEAWGFVCPVHTPGTLQWIWYKQTFLPWTASSLNYSSRWWSVWPSQPFGSPCGNFHSPCWQFSLGSGNFVSQSNPGIPC